MGFKDAKSKVLKCLETGSIGHEVRDCIDTKNLLSTGVVSVAEVTNIIGKARGNNYSCSPHHCDAKIDVHLITRTYSDRSWYIK